MDKFRSRAAAFQSTHPVRGGTVRTMTPAKGKAISIHPPREGWDSWPQSVPG